MSDAEHECFPGFRSGMEKDSDQENKNKKKLQEECIILRKKNEALQKTCAKLRDVLHRFDAAATELLECCVEGEVEGVAADMTKKDVKPDHTSATSLVGLPFGQTVERRKRHRKVQSAEESKDPKKRSPEFQVSEKSKVGLEANGSYNDSPDRSPPPRNRLTSFCDNDIAHPSPLSNAFWLTKNAADRFAWDLYDIVAASDGDHDRLSQAVGFENPNVCFARPHGLRHYIRSLVYETLYSSFENESFSSSSRLPGLARERWGDYFDVEQLERLCGIEDPEFDEFHRDKYVHFWNRRIQNTPLAHFFSILPPGLTQSFIKAAKRVWVFHKVMFPARPAACTFTVEVGDDISDECMTCPVLELLDTGPPYKVGIVIAPGVVTRGFVVQCCEVYPARV